MKQSIIVESAEVIGIFTNRYRDCGEGTFGQEISRYCPIH